MNHFCNNPVRLRSSCMYASHASEFPVHACALFIVCSLFLKDGKWRRKVRDVRRLDAHGWVLRTIGAPNMYMRQAQQLGGWCEQTWELCNSARNMGFVLQHGACQECAEQPLPWLSCRGTHIFSALCVLIWMYC